jgi:hypothetical protein
VTVAISQISRLTVSISGETLNHPTADIVLLYARGVSKGGGWDGVVSVTLVDDFRGGCRCHRYRSLAREFYDKDEAASEVTDESVRSAFRLFGSRRLLRPADRCVDRNGCLYIQSATVKRVEKV